MLNVTHDHGKALETTPYYPHLCVQSPAEGLGTGTLETEVSLLRRQRGGLRKVKEIGPAWLGVVGGGPPDFSASAGFS